MAQQVTAIEVPHYNDSYCRVVINKVPYILRFSYLKADDCWVFAICNLQYEPIVQGIKIVPGIPLNLQYIDDALPPVLWGVKTKLDRVGYHDFWDGKAEFFYLESVE